MLLINPGSSDIKPQAACFGLSILCVAMMLAGCGKVAPLDPKVGDTGQPLSETASSADVLYYGLDLEILPKQQEIQGSGVTRFKILKATSALELRLDDRFQISQITLNNTPAQFDRNHGVITIQSATPLTPDAEVEVKVDYQGKPHVAENAPWAGGTVWGKTPDGKDWIATAVQGEGCDLWWPCKDHFADKADSMDINLTVPAGLTAVTNGVLKDVKTLSDRRQTFQWQLQVPASDYNIALNIGPYQQVSEVYQGINGSSIPVEFWALPDNVDKAKTMIANDLRSQMEFFERKLGPYPWGDQKLGFVETPHLGMEHQTVNAYGKGYKRDDHGFDWLLQHELAHEWFGNLITHEKLNDAWLHEGFGLYMQPAYSLDKFGEAAYNHSMYNSYLGLMNCEPVVREGNVTSNEAFNSDIYGKGGWTLHTLRWLVGEEVFWQATRELLYGTNQTQSLTYPIKPRYRNTNEFIQMVNRLSGKDYNWLFDVYLREAALPELQQERSNGLLKLKWKVPADKTFPMPVPVSINGVVQLVDMSSGSAQLTIADSDHLQIDPQMKVLRKLNLIGDCKENTEKRKKKVDH